MPSDGHAVAPFMAGCVTKHVAMVEVAPGKVACYAGDFTGAPYEDSYRQDAWTLDVASNTWTRRDAYSSADPRPHRPDTMGIGWDAQKQDILLIPGVLTGVTQPPFGAWRHHSDGTWSVDNGLKWGTGMMRGGCADWQTRQWVSIFESATRGGVIRLWNVDNWSLVVDTLWTSGGSDFQCYADSLPCLVGRWVYYVARTIFSSGAHPEVRFYRFNIDTKAVERMANPPVTDSTPESTVLAGSGTKVVWPHILGPEGAIDRMLVYDTVAGTWGEELSRPAIPSNKFLMNSLCSLADGRVLMAGSAFNSSNQTVIIGYQP